MIIDIYCDLEFWRDFMDSCRSNFAISVNDDDWIEIESKRCLYQRLVSDILLHIECTAKELLEEIEREEQEFNETMRVLARKWEMQADGNHEFLDCSFDHEKGAFAEINLNAIYLSNNTCKKKELSNKGILVVSMDDIKDGRFIMDKPICINRNGNYDWNIILSGLASVTCNALVICDSYLLRNPKRLKSNLFKVLDTLIPNGIETDFQLTIFTSEEGSFSPGEQIKQRLNPIKEYLQQSKPKTKVTLYIVIVNTSQQHDRQIISNNAYIECPGGFDLINNNGLASKQTTIWISFPKFSSPRDEQSYESVIRQAENNICHNLVLNSEGNFIHVQNAFNYNRLLQH